MIMPITKWGVRKDKTIQEVVKMLRTMADEIENEKKIKVDNHKVELPDIVDTKIKVKLKDDQTKFSIKLYWKENDLLKSPETEIDSKHILPAITAKKFKEMKKLMEDSLYNLEENLKKEESINDRNIEIFNITLSDFKKRAKPEWQVSLVELENLTNKLLENLMKSERSAAIYNIQQIWELKEKYHIIYK